MPSQALTFVVIGFFQGALYGLLAVGLVLVYRGARVFNFAQGEFGTIAAYVTFSLWSIHKLPFGVAVAVALAVAVISGVVVERLVIRPLFNASRITLLVSTVGVALFIIGVAFVWAQPEVRVLRPIIEGNALESLFGSPVQWQQLLTLLVLAALALFLVVFFRTNLGLAILATSQDPLATRMMGVSVPTISRFLWGFTALLGGVAGILQAGTLGNFVTPGVMTSTSLFPAFTGAVLGGMTSLPGAFLGGLLVGVAQNLGIFYLQQQQIPGASALTVFAMLLLVLLIRPQGLLGSEA